MTDKYDYDNDGIVTQSEIETGKKIRDIEDLSRKHLAQLRLARSSLIGMGVYTILLFMPFIPDERIKLLTSVSELLYISLASVVGAYMGFTSWASKK
tara:strand:+ start:225 stop:515 length:291 start_codon:yes stop_codon:yes gene_type:complete